ncbi:hypothetical protein ABT348_13700 [Streptomyces olivaceus]|uniref:hypothetical protein n=1 Tax=Streptomyces olivaceus TaxID=47716 RepID=UPI00331EA0FC
MDELHRRLIHIGVDALADLFAPFGRATAEMPAATERVITAYEAAGFAVELTHQSPEHTYTRLSVTDPASGSSAASSSCKVSA